MKAVILDGYTLNPGDLSWNELSAQCELTVYPRTAEGEAAVRIGDAPIVFTNKVPITRQLLQDCPNIRYVGVLATGYNVVDVEAAAELGVTVTNIPTYGTTAVAQFVFALLLELCHHVGHHDAAVHQGRWSSCPDWCFWDYPLMELAGLTMGIVGFGRIGQAVGRLAQAFGMKVLAFDEIRRPELENEDCRYVSLEELFAQSDVISLHCPLLPGTRGIINRSNIETMKNGVMLVNTARGPLVCEADLAAALNEGKVGGAGLDVVAEEPIRADNPLLTAKNCILTPHIAWAPRASRQRLMHVAAENLRAYLVGTPVNLVQKNQ